MPCLLESNDNVQEDVDMPASHASPDDVTSASLSDAPLVPSETRRWHDVTAERLRILAARSRQLAGMIFACRLSPSPIITMVSQIDPYDVPRELRTPVQQHQIDAELEALEKERVAVALRRMHKYWCSSTPHDCIDFG